MDSPTAPCEDTITMANQNTPWMDWARQMDAKAFEDRWLAAIEKPDVSADELLGVLSALCQQGEASRAASLGWAWLVMYKEQVPPAEALDLGRKLIMACAEGDALREEILGLYRTVYGDRPGIEMLFEASGLAGAKSPRRALRTLDTCLVGAGQLGAALLGKVGGEMMATDPFVVELFNLPHWAQYVSMAVFVLFVCGFSKWILIRQKAKIGRERADGNAVTAGDAKSADVGK